MIVPQQIFYKDKKTMLMLLEQDDEWLDTWVFDTSGEQPVLKGSLSPKMFEVLQEENLLENRPALYAACERLDNGK